jgi:hypothetical protein
MARTMSRDEGGTTPHTQGIQMPPRQNDASDVARFEPREDAVRALEDLADRLDAIATKTDVARWIGRSDAEAAASAAAQIRAIPETMTATMRAAFEVGRVYGHREVWLAEMVAQNRALSALLARQAWGGGNPGNA